MVAHVCLIKKLDITHLEDNYSAQKNTQHWLIVKGLTSSPLYYSPLHSFLYPKGVGSFKHSHGVHLFREQSQKLIPPKRHQA